MYTILLLIYFLVAIKIKKNTDKNINKKHFKKINNFQKIIKIAIRWNNFVNVKKIKHNNHDFQNKIKKVGTILKIKC